ncbi:MAG: hypothetical protein JWN76_2592 [Chitinophagaceae bacterium]|nr:hypothetical protein [Chitinophagaceae bacterium]
MIKRIPLVFTLFMLFSVGPFCCYAGDTLGAPAKGQLQLVLNGLKEEQADNKTAAGNLVTAQSELDSKQPGLVQLHDAKVAEAKGIFNDHNNVHQVGSTAYNFWQQKLVEANAAANGFQDQIDVLQAEVDKAQKQKDESDNRLQEWQQKLLDIGKVKDWGCFFDNNCGEKASAPENGMGTRAAPNGAPGIFSVLNQEYKDRLKIDNKTVPVPAVAAPQKGMIDEATDKVRSYFRDIIKTSSELKKRVTSAVNAVRG